MNPFTFTRAQDAADAVRHGALEGSRYLGGGTNLVDLMRETIERPAQLVDVSELSHTIEERADGSLLVASQDGHNVYHVPKTGAPRVVAADIAVPAAIGHDPKRRRLLVPQIRLATLAFYDLPAE